MRALIAAVVLAACGDNLPGPANGHLFDGNVWGGNVAVADGWVYFTTYGEGDGEDHALWRVRPDGGAAEPIWVGHEGIFGYGLAVGDGKLYWSEAVDRQLTAQGVYELNIGGGHETQIGTFTTKFAAYGGVSFDAGHVYAADLDQVLDVPLGGTQTIAYSGDVSWMVHRGGHLYVLSNNILLEDGNLIASFTSADGAFDVDDHAAYVGDGTTVRRIPLDSTITAASVAVDATPGRILVGPHQVYALVGTELDSFDFDTGTARALANGLRSYGTLAADDTSVYVAVCCDMGGFVARYDQ